MVALERGTLSNERGSLVPLAAGGRVVEGRGVVSREVGHGDGRREAGPLSPHPWSRDLRGDVRVSTRV